MYLLRQKTSDITRADRAIRAGEWELAARLYRKALGRNPNRPAIWVQLGHAFKEIGRLPEAERAYRTALFYEPQNPDTEIQLAHLLAMDGRKAESAAAYLRAYSLDPSCDGSVKGLIGLGWSTDRLAQLKRMSSVDVEPSG